MFQEGEDINIREYFYTIRKWKWMIVVFCVVFAVFAAFKTYRQIPVYKATARLVIDTKVPKADPFKDDYYWDRFMDAEDRNTQHMLLKSRELATRVAERLGMLDDAKPASAEQAPTERTPSKLASAEQTPFEQAPALQEEQAQVPSFSWRSAWTMIPTFFGAKSRQAIESAPVVNPQDSVIQGISNRIIVEPVKDSHLVDVSVMSPKPAEAVRIVNTVAEEFVAQDLEVKTAASRDAVKWLLDEVEAARQRVADSETALQEYKKTNALIAMDDHQSIVMQRLATLSNAVNGAKIERIEFEAQYQELQRYTKAELETFSQVVSNTTIHWLKIDLSRAEQELAEARGKYRDKHPAVMAAQAQVDAIQTRIDEEVKKILTSFAREYEMAVVKERDLIKAFEEQKQEAFELNQKAITYNVLANEVESNRWVYNSLLQKMKEMSIHERLETSNIRIVDKATMPHAPINIKTERTLLLALFMGLAVGVSLSFFFEYLDNSIKTPEELKQYVQIPFLGFIPKMTSKALKNAQPEQIVAIAPKSIVSEAYRSLRTSVSFSAMKPPSSDEASSHEASSSEAPSTSTGSTLLITSAEPSEGKSCTVANLAIAMAQSGKKTLLVDCDFRRPQVHKIFHVQNERGFADLLSNMKPQGKIHIQCTDIPNLDVFPCGAVPPNPSELLELPAARKILDALTTRYDVVLLDSPPINSVTDPVILSRLTDGVVLVVRAGETKRDIVQRATEQLDDAGANVLGGVINSVDMRKNKYYYYYAYHYSHYYGKDDVAIALK